MENKLFSLLVCLEVFSVFLLLRYAWPDYFTLLKDSLRSIVFSNFRVFILLPFSLSLMILVTFIEFFSYLLVFRQGSVVIGFPYALYSFSVGRILVRGVIFDFIFYSLIIYLVAKAVGRPEVKKLLLSLDGFLQFFFL